MTINKPEKFEFDVINDPETADAFSNVDNFDYELFEDKKSKMKIISVPWESDYKNAVDWKTSKRRDDWMWKTHSKEVSLPVTGFKLNKAMQWSPGEQKFVGEIRVEQPSESIQEFNYLVLEAYAKPVSGAEPRLLKFFYFIDATNVVAANTTIMYLTVDAWTTFFDKAELNNFELVRGHAPHKMISSTNFLNNPLDSPVNLMTLEEDLPSLKSKVSYSSLVSLTSDSPRICIATTASFEDPGEMWWNDATSTPAPNSIAPTAGWYHNDTNGFGGYGPRPAVSVERSVSRNGQFPTNINVYSIDPSDYASWKTFVHTSTPQIITTIQAIYYLPSSMISEGSEFTSWGHKFKRVSPQPAAKKLLDLGITKGMFGYEANAADFAKMFTGQFATIKVDDMAGNSAEINVEEISESLEFYGRASSMFPFLKFEAFVNGVGGKSKRNYTVAPLKNMTASIFESKWKDYSFGFDIPTFGIAMTAAEIVLASSSKSRYQERRNIERSLASALASNKTSYDNAVLLATTAYNNTITASNNSYSNALAINAMNKANSDASSNNTKTVGDMSVGLSFDNERDSINTSYNNTKISALANDEAVGGLAVYNARVENDLEISGQALTFASGWASSIGSPGTGANLITGFSQLARNNKVAEHQVNKVQMAAMISTAWEIQPSMVYTYEGGITTSYTLGGGYSRDRKVADAIKSYSETVNTRNNTVGRNINTANNNNELSINSRSKTVADSVALDIRDSERTIASASRSASNSVASASKTTSDSNAQRSKDASMASMLAKEADMRAQAPLYYGSNSGSVANAFGETGLQISVQRISKADERVVANTFRKYGYRVENLIIENPNLSLMSEFTYWECADAWIDASRISDAIALKIKSMFINGVAMWRDPDNIRRVRLEENI